MATWRVPAFGLVVIVLGVTAFAAPKEKGKNKPAEDGSAKENLTELSLEVDALQTIHQFALDKGQLAELARLAADMPARGENRGHAKAPEKYHKALSELREALRGDDDAAIDERASAADALRDKEKIELDDAVEITDAARKRAPGFLTQLRARQVAAYVAVTPDDDLDGPLERLAAAFEKARKLTGDEWAEARDETAEAVGWLVVGLDAEGAAKVAGRAKELLDRAHALKDADYAARRGDLDKEAKELAGDLGPTEVLRRVVEHALAELLSNPRLAAAVEGRLKSN